METTNGAQIAILPPVTMVSPPHLVSRTITPGKPVISDTIEDEYVNFILHCNPAVPDVDTTGLREAFRVPPKSDGKSFSTFTLFELIKQLHEKELKTWAELALKLGVAPPDQEKGQSSQKIQQYAVRLKRWMHSMHVDAFFDYLLGNPHPYYTEIPTESNPVLEDGRDGVAAEDDMALRALLPHIKPRRGRRKTEDELNKSPAQRPRLESPVFVDGLGRARPGESWTAHPDGQRAFLFPPTDQARSNGLPGSDSAFPWPSEITHTPLSAYPQSAMTPVNGRAYWPDPSEPRSAITPSKAKGAFRRYGAKVVSSAWRSGGAAAKGKTRGRPPINRISENPHPTITGMDGVFQADVREQSISQATQPTSNPAVSSAPTSIPDSKSLPELSQPSRPARPGRLSLQVPERAGGNVRLATPPLPIVTVNGDKSIPAAEAGPDPGSNLNVAPNLPAPNGLRSQSADSSILSDTVNNEELGQQTDGSLEEEEDLTNVREVENLFVSELLLGEWRDAKGHPISSCSLDEAAAMARTIIGNMSSRALTPETFLTNLAALAGGSVLHRGVRARITRLEEGQTHNKYSCRWTLHYGSHKGNFTLTETVAHSLWKKKAQREESDGGTGPHARVGQQVSEAEYWKQRYRDLVHLLRANHEQATDLTIATLETLRRPPVS
ncbi:ARS binding protein 2-domain-containing protein [Xylariales sp. PMI_506]|nr:ARS binding protein 2-domain-containing protein [Xylariales sp. PMI_506]